MAGTEKTIWRKCNRQSVEKLKKAKYAKLWNETRSGTNRSEVKEKNCLMTSSEWESLKQKRKKENVCLTCGGHIPIDRKRFCSGKCAKEGNRISATFRGGATNIKIDEDWILSNDG